MQSVNRYLEELYSVNESKNGLIVVKVIFDDKNSLITSIFIDQLRLTKFRHYLSP